MVDIAAISFFQHRLVFLPGRVEVVKSLEPPALSIEPLDFRLRRLAEAVNVLDPRLSAVNSVAIVELLNLLFVLRVWETSEELVQVSVLGSTPLHRVVGRHQRRGRRE